MPQIFQNGGRFGNFQTHLFSLASYSLITGLAASECSKPLPKSHFISSWKAWFPQFLLFLLSTFIFLLKKRYPCPVIASWVSFFTVLQRLGQGCAMTGTKEEIIHFLLMKFMVVTVRGFVVWRHLNYCSCLHRYINLHSLNLNFCSALNYSWFWSDAMPLHLSLVVTQQNERTIFIMQWKFISSQDCNCNTTIV